MYLKTIKKLKIKTACIPFAIGDKDALEKGIIAGQKKGAPNYLYNSFFKDFFKDWRVKTKEGTYLGLPAEILIAYKYFDIKVQKPLSFYGMEVDYLLLENNFMLEHAQQEGIAAINTFITGGVFDDELFQLNKDRTHVYENICTEFLLDKTKKCMLIALPPLEGKKSLTGDLINVDILLDLFLPSTIDFNNINVVISPHPRLNISDLKAMEFPSNIIIVNKPVELLIPFADIFVTTYSSTIRVAAALQKNILNYDFLRLGYRFFSDIKNLKTVENKEEYINSLEEFMAKIQKSEYSNFENNKLSSMLDGHSHSRILSKLKELI